MKRIVIRPHEKKNLKWAFIIACCQLSVCPIVCKNFTFIFSSPEPPGFPTNLYTVSQWVNGIENSFKRRGISLSRGILPQLLQRSKTSRGHYSTVYHATSQWVLRSDTNLSFGIIWSNTCLWNSNWCHLLGDFTF